MTSAASPPEVGRTPTVTMPSDIRRTLSWFAHLIDAQIPLYAVEDEEEFAQRHLRLDAHEIISVREYPSPMSFTLAARAFARDLTVHPPTAVAGCDSDESPAWDRLRLEGADESVPGALVAFFAAGTLADVALAVCFDNRFKNLEIDVFAADSDHGVATDYLSGLLSRGRGELNCFRGKTLRVKPRNPGLTFEPIPGSTSTRDDLVLPAAVWREIDVNITGVIARRDLLDAMRLGTNRGLLLYGPPGTGKTAACRVIAAEIAGQVTVLFCEASVVSEHLEELYAELVHLGPSLVVLEDIDLVVGQRTSGSGRALLGFLTALDGVMSQHKDVITVATTNDPKALDAAAKRAARFDRLIEVPLPCIEARATILARYLGEVAERVDVGAVAQATNGASGADLRELVRRSVLEYGDDLTTSRLLRLVDTGAWHDPSVIGLYL